MEAGELTPTWWSRIPPWVRDTAVGVLLLLGMFFPLEFPGASPPGVLTWVIYVVAVALIHLRRRWPVASLIVGVALYGLAGFSGELGPALVVPVAIAVFQVALTSRRRVALPVTVATIIVMCGLSLLGTPVDFGQRGFFVSTQIVQIAAIIAFAAAVGDATRSRRAAVVAIMARAERAEQTRELEASRRVAEERLTIARDLHDLVAHQIAVINLHAGVASRRLRDDPADVERSLAVIREASRSVLRRIGDLLAELRTGRAAAAADPPEDLDRLVHNFLVSGLTVTLSVSGDPSYVPASLHESLSMILQEVLTNALKHSLDQKCDLVVNYGEERVEITATNRCAPREGRETLSGHGLQGIRERLVASGGSLNIVDAPPLFTVEISAPIRSAVEA